MQLLEDILWQVFDAEAGQNTFEVLPEQRIEGYERDPTLTHGDDRRPVFAQPCAAECLPIEIDAAWLQDLLGFAGQGGPHIQHRAEHVEQQGLHGVLAATLYTHLRVRRTSQHESSARQNRACGERTCTL